MDGYWNDKEATDAAITSEGWMKTGACCVCVCVCDVVLWWCVCAVVCVCVCVCVVVLCAALVWH
jgi:hypothetical protein